MRGFGGWGDARRGLACGPAKLAYERWLMAQSACGHEKLRALRGTRAAYEGQPLARVEGLTCPSLGGT